MIEKLKPCICGNTDLIHIKNFANYHMIKCECCTENVKGFLVHRVFGGSSYEAAIKNWNNRT